MEEIQKLINEAEIKGTDFDISNNLCLRAIAKMMALQMEKGGKKPMQKDIKTMHCCKKCLSLARSNDNLTVYDVPSDCFNKSCECHEKKLANLCNLAHYFTEGATICECRMTTRSMCHCGKDGHALNSINCPVHQPPEKKERWLGGIVELTKKQTRHPFDLIPVGMKCVIIKAVELPEYDLLVGFDYELPTERRSLVQPLMEGEIVTSYDHKFNTTYLERGSWKFVWPVISSKRP